MRYMMMHKLDDSNPALWQPTPEFGAKMGAFIEEVNKAGVLLAADGLLPSSAGAAIVRRQNGETTVVDGPFAEAKEVVGGYGIFQVRDHAEAVEWATRYSALFDEIEVEVRRMSDYE